METLKTAVIVVLLLAVLYGVYLVLNKPDPTPPGDLAWEAEATQPLQVDLGLGGSSTGFGTDDASSPMIDSMGVPTLPQTVPADDPVEPLAPPETIEPPAEPDWSADPSPADTAAAPEQPAWPPAGDWPAAAAPEAPPSTIPNAPPTPAETPPSEDSANITPLNTGPTSEASATPGESAYARNIFSSEWQGGESTAEAGGSTAETAMEAATTEGIAASTAVGSRSVVESAIQSAQAKITDEQWYDALLTLSIIYGSPDIGDEENEQLLDLLDPLAGKVIYSNEHLIESSHKVARGEKLTEIAERFQVPWQLLANVNGIENPEPLSAGTDLKIVRGPFRAEIDLRRGELTIFAGRLYAGRFPITVGSDPVPQPGDYRVYDKQPGRTYYAGDGQTIPAGDPSNPYGGVWIDLGGDLCIHGSSDSAQPGMGCLSLSPIDANDLFGILSKGSAVTILR